MKQIMCSISLLVLLTVTGCVAQLPENELYQTRKRLNHYLFNEETLTQSEMTILSQYILQLANMEKYMIEYRIWNQPDYGKIEKAFIADCEAWDKRAEAEAKKPSEYEGGSLAPMDHNVRMTQFLQKRIDELKSKWQKK